MSPEVKAAIITGVLGLLGIIVTLYRDDIANLFRKRRRSIEGSWVGEGRDIEVPPYLTYRVSYIYEVNFKFEQSGNKIKSEFVIYEKTQNKHFQAKGKGEFISDSYIHIEYTILVEGSIHFGAIILHINDLGNKMDGYFLAKRVVQDGIVLGQFQLSKISSRD